MPIKLKIRGSIRGCLTDLWIGILVLGGMALCIWFLMFVRERWLSAWLPTVCLMSALLPFLLISINWIVGRIIGRIVDTSED